MRRATPVNASRDHAYARGASFHDTRAWQEWVYSEGRRPVFAMLLWVMRSAGQRGVLIYPRDRCGSGCVFQAPWSYPGLRPFPPRMGGGKARGAEREWKTWRGPCKDEVSASDSDDMHLIKAWLSAFCKLSPGGPIFPDAAPGLCPASCSNSSSSCAECRSRGFGGTASVCGAIICEMRMP